MWIRDVVGFLTASVVVTEKQVRIARVGADPIRCVGDVAAAVEPGRQIGNRQPTTPNQMRQQHHHERLLVESASQSVDETLWIIGMVCIRI